MLEELGHQARLADARISLDERDARFPGDDLVEPELEPGHLVGASNEPVPREAGPARPIRRVPHRRGVHSSARRPYSTVSRQPSASRDSAATTNSDRLEMPSFA